MIKSVSRIFVLLTLVFPCGAVLADATADFLAARPVRNFVRIGFVNEKSPQLVYALDSFDENDQKTLIKDSVLRTEGEVAIYIANFNPLRDSFTVATKETPSPNYAALKAFLDDLKAFQAMLPPSGGGSQAAPGVARTDCQILEDLIKTAHDALDAKELTADGLKKHVDAASGLEGVNSAITNLRAASGSITKNITDARTAMKTILSDYSSVAGRPPDKTCASVSSAILVDYISVTGSAAEVLARKAALKKAIDELVAELEEFTDADDWRGANGEKTDFRITRFTPTFENDRSVTVSAVRRSLSATNGVLTVTTSDKTKQEVSFLVKRDSFFVAERAVAGVYNHLKYPKYGTAKNAAGDTIVERSKDDYDPVNAAMMLNLVMRTRMGSVAYPMLQLGVATGKDFPGLLAGIGLRFTQPSAFSLSVGGMITRYKDLDGVLKEGDKVAGTSDIESHLEFKNSPVVIYGAIQVKF